MCAESEEKKCKRIVSRSASGENYVIESNRKVWIAEDGTKFYDISMSQYSGPVWTISGGNACPGGYRDDGGFW